MDFSNWLADSGRSCSSVARQLGTSHTTVIYLRDGQRHPGVNLITRIQSVTGGAVGFEDWSLRRLIDPAPWRGDE